jgi:hypothetical protein
MFNTEMKHLKIKWATCTISELVDLFSVGSEFIFREGE